MPTETELNAARCKSPVGLDERTNPRCRKRSCGDPGGCRLRAQKNRRVSSRTPPAPGTSARCRGPPSSGREHDSEPQHLGPPAFPGAASNSPQVPAAAERGRARGETRAPHGPLRSAGRGTGGRGGGSRGGTVPQAAAFPPLPSLRRRGSGVTSRTLVTHTANKL